MHGKNRCCTFVSIKIIVKKNRNMLQMNRNIAHTSLYIGKVKRKKSLFFRFGLFLCACFSLYLFQKITKILTQNRIFFKKVSLLKIVKVVLVYFASLRIWIIGKNNLALSPLSACWYFGQRQGSTTENLFFGCMLSA